MKAPDSSALRVRPHDGGYCIGRAFRTDDGTEEPVILPCDPRASGSRQVPLPKDAFEQFADTCISAEGAVAFANRYGLLGCGEPGYAFESIITGEDGEDGEDYFPWPAETLADWLEHARLLRTHVAWWDALRVPRLRDMERHTMAVLHWGALFVEPSVGRALATVDETLTERGLPRVDPELTTTLLDGQDIGAVDALWRAVQGAGEATRMARMRDLGWALLDLSVTARMREHQVVPALVPAETHTRGYYPEARVVSTLSLTANTLIGAFWLQLAEAITKRVGYRACAGCGKTMTIHPDANRTNRTTCSDACRSKVHRAKKSASLARGSRRAK